MLSSTEGATTPAFRTEVNDISSKSHSEQTFNSNDVPALAQEEKVHNAGVGVAAACLQGEPDYCYWLMTTLRLSLVIFMCYQIAADFIPFTIPVTGVLLFLTAGCADFENPFLSN